jgi:hypothetical protein
MYSHVPAAILFLAVTVLAAYRNSSVDPSAANNVAHAFSVQRRFRVNVLRTRRSTS